MNRVCRIPEDAKAGGRRDGLFEQLQVLGAQLQTLVRPSGNVAPGTCQATNDSAPYWIGGKAYDDWYRHGGLLRSKGGRGARGGNEVHLQTDEFGGERGEAIRFPLGEPNFKRNVLALNPAEVAEPTLERLEIRLVTFCRPLVEISDARHLPRLLPLGGERRGQEHRTRASEERAPVHYWITSSARASSEGGIVSPSALAVLRLMTSSNFVGCSIGMSPGLVPFKILSTKTAQRRQLSKRSVA